MDTFMPHNPACSYDLGAFACRKGYTLEELLGNELEIEFLDYPTIKLGYASQASQFEEDPEPSDHERHHMRSKYPDLYED